LYYYYSYNTSYFNVIAIVAILLKTAASHNADMEQYIAGIAASVNPGCLSLYFAIYGTATNTMKNIVVTRRIIVPVKPSDAGSGLSSVPPKYSAIPVVNRSKNEMQEIKVIK